MAQKKMKILQKISLWLYKRIPKEETPEEKLKRLSHLNYHDALKQIIRGKLGGITLEAYSYRNLPKEDQNDAIYRLSEISRDKYFNNLLNLLVRNQETFIAREARNMDQVSFGRATINGIELIREELALAETEMKERERKGEKFDKFKIMPE